ncbi:MAG: response regulator [Rhodospirillaceae bacterium]|nr:response regulator [Rhodospirillaceae bacterium]
MKIFIVDNDNDMIRLMSALLGQTGHEVSSQVAGSYALSEISEQKPDCILIDLMMAEMDGLDFCRAVKKRPGLSNAKCIFVSGREDAIWKERAMEAGAVGYITKPIDVAGFSAEVERLVGA